MNYGLVETIAINKNECLVVGLLANTEFPPQIKALDNQHQGLITRIFNKLQENGDTGWQTDVDGGSLLVIHCGDAAQYKPDVLSKRMANITQLLINQRIALATLCLPQLPNNKADWQIQQMLLQVETSTYQLLDFKSQNMKAHAIKDIHFNLPGATPAHLKSAQSIAKAINLTRDLANCPANICTPSYLAQQAIKLAHAHNKLDVHVHDKKQMLELGMGSLLAVAQGSHEAPQLIEIHYTGTHVESAPVILVGKGITFDSGGISLKHAETMNEMKFDMAGAASVLGTLKACALLNLPINVIGLLACAENMPGGGAIKPGDIVTSSSGQTIEIINTDAEGRLVLADALTYAERFNPKLVIDIATLTGAVIIALGSVSTGVMTQDDQLADLILTAAAESEDKAWRLPLDDDYQESIASPIADMVNSTFDRSAGSITAACFLSRFTKKYRWAHLDIAGTAWVSGKDRRATGRPVPLLIQLLRDLAHAS